MIEYDQLVGAIYDCAADPDLWPKTLSQIRDTLNSAYALVGYLDRSDVGHGAPPILVRRHSGWDESWLNQLDRQIAQIPSGDQFLFGNVDVAWTQMQQTSEGAFHETEFYRGWVEPQGLRDTLNISYLQRDALTGVLALPSYKSRPLYERADCRLVEKLSPHIRRAMLINGLIDRKDMALALYRHVLDNLSAAVFIVGAGRRLIFTNAAGDSMLTSADHISVSNGVLQGRRGSSHQTSLDEAIERALAGDQALGISGIGVPLFGANGDRVSAYVLPMQGNGVRAALSPGHCAVFISRRGEQQPIAIEILRTLFDLTHAEARIALLIAKGNSPQIIAGGLDISVHTVRSHLKQIYAKTETPDQTGLGGLVNGLLPPV